MTYGSLFSGIGGADLGLSQASLRCLWHCEADAKCRAVLGRRFPGVPCYPDVRAFPAQDVDLPDAVWLSPPCQDLSVAGRREGLSGERSGLFYDAICVLGAFRERGWRGVAVMEQVPGLLSSHAGADFHRVVASFQGLGALDLCWRTLDSKHFGVPQRRRRVYLVADFGGERAYQILFEPKGVCRDIAPCQEPGQGTYSDAARGAGVGCFRYQNASDGLIRDELSGALKSSCATTDERSVPAYAVYDARGNGDGSTVPNMTGDHNDRVTDYTAVVAFCETARHLDESLAIDETPPMKTPPNTTAVAFTCKDYGGDVSDQSPTLRAMQYDKSHLNGGGQLAVAMVNMQGSKGNAVAQADGPSYTLNAMHGHDVHAVAFAQNQLGEVRTGDVSGTLNRNSNASGRCAPLVQASSTVRRLTPTECERLQGFPDGWTDGQSDSARYRQLGNAVTVPVARWLGTGVLQASARNGADRDAKGPLETPASSGGGPGGSEWSR